MNNNQNQKTLPDDIIFSNILPRIKVKPLLRFKSVSKYWYSSISSPHFANTHLNFSSNHHNFLLVDNLRKCYTLAYDICLTNDLVQLNSDAAKLHVSFIVGCSNGLVCLCVTERGKSKSKSFALWNPATREYREIWLPRKEECFGYGFGYVSVLDDYVIFLTYSDGVVSSIFSLRSGRWRDVEFSLGGGMFYPVGMLLGDALYWYVPWKRCIVGFDLVTEELRMIPVMDWVCEYEAAELYVYKGCLSLCCKSGEQGCDVWMLKREDDPNSWKKLFSVPIVVKFLDFSTSGKALIQVARQLKLVDLSLEKIVTSRGIDFNCYVRGAHRYVESITSPFGMP